jgi:hypothetical protein
LVARRPARKCNKRGWIWKSYNAAKSQPRRLNGV